MITKSLNRLSAFLNTDARYLLKGSFWLGGSQTIAAFASFGTAVAFANLLPQTDYGVYKYVLGIMAMLTVTSLPELSTASVQAVARGFSGTIMPALAARVRFSLVGVALGLAIAGYYAFKGNLELALPFVIIALALPLIEPLGITQAFFIGKRRFRDAALYTSVTAVLSALAVILVLLFSDSVWLILLAYISATVVSRFFRLRTVWRESKKEPVDEQALSFGKHLSFSVAITGVAANADTIILWHATNPETLALYAFAVAALTPARTFLKTLVNLAHPKIAVADQTVLKNGLLPRIVRAWLILALPVAFFIAIMPFVFEWFFPLYVAAVPFAQVMALGLIFTPNKLLSVALVAKQDAKPLYSLNAINSVARIIFFVVLVPLFGAWGAVWATLLSQVFSGSATLLVYKKYHTK